MTKKQIITFNEKEKKIMIDMIGLFNEICWNLGEDSCEKCPLKKLCDAGIENSLMKIVNDGLVIEE